MFELHQSLHMQNGICLWTLMAMIVFLIMVVIWGLHLYRQNKREYNFEKEMENKAEERKAAENAEIAEKAARN